MIRKKLKAAQSGAAGEYFVAAELSRRGWIATLTPKNTQGFDILAANEDGTRLVGIQVKTTYGGHRWWTLNAKADELCNDHLYYVFVRLNWVDEPPSFHIVDSKTVSAYCRKGRQEWIAGLKRDGTPRKDTPMRIFRDQKERYLNKWETLGIVD